MKGANRIDLSINVNDFINIYMYLNASRWIASEGITQLIQTQ